MPTEAASATDRVLGLLDQVAASDRPSFAGHAEIGAGRDSNVNSATNAGQFAIPAFDGPLFNVAPGSGRRNDKFGTLAAGASVQAPLAQGWSLFGGIDARSTLNATAHDLNTRIATGSNGLSHVEGLHAQTVAVQTNAAWISSSPYRTANGASLQWQSQLDAADRSVLGSAYARRLGFGATTTRPTCWPASGSRWPRSGNSSRRFDTLALHRTSSCTTTPWTRHFDDRLGLSQGELERLMMEPIAPLLAVEQLLSDRPRDLVARGADNGVEPEFGFKMEVPKNLYDLSVRRGTLTTEERYKINEHMVHRIMMLERMPFPKHLRRVPEYAGTHHERIDGTGYPRQLSGAELSVPSRIMAVADIFEALTASDRPYKKPKKLSEALRVLQSMAGDHIDADIYDLFLTAGVYRDFAAKHLSADQIDVTDATPYPSRAARG